MSSGACVAAGDYVSLMLAVATWRDAEDRGQSTLKGHRREDREKYYCRKMGEEGGSKASAPKKAKKAKPKRAIELSDDSLNEE